MAPHHSDDIEYICRMRISGFTMGKNAGKLYYPIGAVVASALPLVDEFIVALGDSDADDDSREQILRLNSPKVRIVDTVWDIDMWPNGMENAHQTDIAKAHCTGDWCLYLQADEVIHEQYLDTIHARCEQLLDDERIEGLLFKYRHFWGDYDHYQNAHGWYPHEIRMVRNDLDIHSFQSAQSFRRIPDFDGLSYREKEGTHKLNVALVDAYIYHYGWVRPPRLMQNKSRSLQTIHKGKTAADQLYDARDLDFDYGNMSRLPKHDDTHPEVMKEWIERFDWADQLNYEKGYKPNRELMKHETTKNKILSWVEQKLNGGKQFFGYSNWNIIDV